MPRKESITKKDIDKAAFSYARKYGMEELTARKLAAHAGCSTQPIFRIYQGMEEVQTEVVNQAAVFFADFYQKYPKSQSTPFANLGLAYISFAEKEKHLFKILFLSSERNGMSLYELLNGADGNVMKEIMKAKEDGCENPQELFMKMWIFIHGAACMTITGDYDLSITETITQLKDVYKSFS